ncbi:MAG TPA: NADPH-dependent FMN reductase [Chthonomonadaceae bacterium]|nr:NADPH-dependent FMN reductase [Chthonomonadaceae bacterium]
MRILAISGSLRQASSNTTLLRAAVALAPEGVEMALYEGLGDLPHFNPDLEPEEPAAVQDLRAWVKWADGLLISSPEYAHGVPGVLKNALDWLVSGEEFIGKPVALFQASPGGEYMLASLTETITVMSGRIFPEVSLTVSLRGKRVEAADVVADPEKASALRAALTAYAQAIESTAA